MKRAPEKRSIDGYASIFWRSFRLGCAKDGHSLLQTFIKDYIFLFSISLSNINLKKVKIVNDSFLVFSQLSYNQPSLKLVKLY
jgi:hypothetical protein